MRMHAGRRIIIAADRCSVDHRHWHVELESVTTMPLLDWHRQRLTGEHRPTQFWGICCLFPSTARRRRRSREAGIAICVITCIQTRTDYLFRWNITGARSANRGGGNRLR